MRKLSYQPKNPKHFVALCFIELRNDQSLRQGHELMHLVWEEKGIALFRSAYGYFFVHHNNKVLSKEFIKTEKEARELIP